MKTLFQMQYNWHTREKGIISLIKSYNINKNELKQLNSYFKSNYVIQGKANIVGVWLLFCSFGVLSMIIVGGYVRLTKSGLSMIRWDLTKILPPLNKKEWDFEFNEYKKHPQFINDNPDMNIKQFKRIYYLEFIHRQMGKVLGIFFVFPFFYFLIKGYIKRALIYNLCSLLAIGSLQGFLGWWMVKSGLKESLGKNYKEKQVKVAPYRLALHFITAVSIYGVLLSTSLFLIQTHPILKRSIIEYKALGIARHAVYSSLLWNLLTLITGSLMAGSYAGKIINTFPKMGDIWFPSKKHLTNGYSINIYNDILNNQFIIHFNHRLIATVNLIAIVFNAFKIINIGIISPSVGINYLVLLIATIFQYSLGIINIYSGCKIETAQLHQFIGMLSYSICIFGIVLTRKARPNQMNKLISFLLDKDRVKLINELKLLKNESPKIYNIYFINAVKNNNLNI